MTASIALFPAPPEAPSDSFTWLSSQVGGSIGPPGGEVSTLAMAPGNPDRLYAGTTSGHIFVTDDGARLWRDCRVLLPREAVLHRMAVDPGSPDTAYAVFWLPQGGGGLIKTLDAGTNWETLSPPGSPALRAVALAPSSSNTLYVGGPSGVWRSGDGGKGWVAASGGSRPLREVESLAVDPRSPLHVYAGTWRQAYRSWDGGASWSLMAEGMALDRDVFTITVSPTDPDALFAGTCGWLYTSTDGGAHWTWRNRGIPADQRRVHTIAVDPVAPHRVWAGMRGGIYRSQDDANSFNLVYGGVSVSAIATDPKGARVFAGTEELGVLANLDGKSFSESNAGLFAARIAAFDAMPGDLRVLFAARTEKPGVQSIQVSRDAGRTWARLAPAVVFTKVRFLRAIARPAPQLLVICEGGSWSKIDLDGGTEAVAPPPGRLAGIEVVNEREMVVAATDAGLFLVRTDSLPPGRATPPAKRAEGWRRLNAGPLSALAVTGDCFLAVGPGRALRGCLSALAAGDPAEEVRAEGLPGGVLAVALGSEKNSRAYAITRSQILFSEDRGATWSAISMPWPAKDLRAVAFDPSQPDQVVALDSHGVLVMGYDRGRRWLALGNDPWLGIAQDFRMSAAEPGLALVATLGHSVRVVSLKWEPAPKPGAPDPGTAGVR